MLIKQTLLSNQKLIDTAIRKIKPGFIKKANGSALDFLYNTHSLALHGICEKALRDKSLKTREYFAVIDALIERLAESRRENNPVAQQVRLDALLYLLTIMNKAIEGIKKDHLQQQNFEKVNSCQETIEAIIKLHFEPSFSLQRTFNLSGIAQEYNDSYDREYGQGTLGFFKLPIKRFFQQSSRSAELKFLEDVEYYCQKTPSLSDIKKNQLKFSAAGLVSLKISSEDFGKKSILAKILHNRIQESGQGNDLNEIIDHFLNECTDRKIKVPAHLEKFFLNGLKPSVMVSHASF